ncbi:MAG: sigma-70 family RNA polymerase sigma factor, partial [Kofleriaceae bacterium]
VGHVEIARNIARALARQYAALLGLDDVIGPAMVGLCEAAARFDWSRAEPFLAFATQRIRGAVLDEVRRQSWQGRIVHKRRREVSEARWALAQAGEPCGDGPVAAYLGLTVAAVQNAGEGVRVAQHVEVAKLPSPSLSPASRVEEAQQLAQLERARATLPEREATMLRLHYDVEMSLAEIARSLELTLGHVRHVHAAALARLRAALFDAESSRSSV